MFIALCNDFIIVGKALVHGNTGISRRYDCLT